MIAILLAAALLSTSTERPVCVKLTADFVENERLWAWVHNHNLETAKFLPEYEKKLKDDDRDFALKADRIVTLIIANKCPAPDHVASWATHPPDEK